MSSENLELTVYPVYILARVADEIYNECSRAVPNETLGRLLGYRLQWQDQNYVKIIDWVQGSLDVSHVHAQFTPNGTRESELFLDERYGISPERPCEIGLFHSHPFGHNPHFSGTDYNTFLTFPYNEPGNVFILIDPLSSYFKTFIVEKNSCSENNYNHQLRQIPYICYSPYITS